jgi:ABC-2 type transport system permease protein
MSPVPASPVPASPVPASPVPASMVSASTVYQPAYRRAYALSDTRVMVARSLRRTVRDPEAFLTALALPVILMLLFVYVFGGAFRAGVGTTYANYVVPGLIVLCAGFGAGTTAVAVATDMSSGIVDRFRSMPIASWAVLAGQVAASLMRNLLATALVIGAGLAVGWRPVAGPLAWLGAIAMVVLFIGAISWLAACFGLLVGSPEAATGATFAFMFVPYLSSAFVPADTMTRVLRPIAANQPFTPVIETLRGLWMGHTSTGAAVGHEAWLAVGYCAAILVISASAASWLFRHRTAGR